tara:strand:- start:393 stop:830 length:438 start_codon:yes stop_codon:yes gene_type:complete
MLSLIGSVLGFGTSFLPKVMDYFQDKQDKKHELFLMDKQLEQQIHLNNQKMQMMDITADIEETKTLHKEHASITKKSSQWCINLSSTVRPVITYCLFIEFAALTLSVNMGWMDLVQYATIWNSEFQAIWAAVVSFWFGSRSFQRK